MDTQSHIISMLQMMDRPAFCVSDGTIIAANAAARNRLVPVGEPVEPLLVTGREEYAAFDQGWLCLSIRLHDIICGVSIHRVDSFHIFTMENGTAGGELQVLALAAQHLREPLSNIMTATERLFPEVIPEADATANDQAARISKGIHQLMRVVFNMSDASRYKTSTPRMETQDVDSVLRDIFDQAAVLCEQSGVRLEYSGLSSPAYSLIDSEQLERCVYNILSNSMRSSRDLQWIRASLTRRGNTLYLTVQDSGSAESADANPFDRYLREPSISDSSGLGLGFTLIRACAASHGGTVLWTPGADSGSTLTISLSMRLDPGSFHSPGKRIDYAGERSHGLIELADCLPPDLYKPHKH